MDFRRKSLGKRTMLSGDCIPVVIEADDDSADRSDEMTLEAQVVGLYQRNMPNIARPLAICYDFATRGRRH